jgi:hypothetical protein
MVVVHPLQTHLPDAVTDFVALGIMLGKLRLAFDRLFRRERFANADEMRRQAILRIVPPGNRINGQARESPRMLFDLGNLSQRNSREQRMIGQLFLDDDRIAILPGRRLGDRTREPAPDGPPDRFTF